MSELTAAHSTIEKAREVTSCPQGVDLQDHLKQLVTESLAMKKVLSTIANSEEFHGDTVVCDFDTLVTAAWSALSETPATDSILAGIKADGIRAFAGHLSSMDCHLEAAWAKSFIDEVLNVKGL